MKRQLAAILYVFVSGGSLAADRTQRIPTPDQHESIVLAADPKLTHPAFRQTVVLVTALGDDQHVGVIMNRPTQFSLSNIFPADESSRAVRGPVYFGGPMDTDTIVVITNGGQSPGGLSVPLGESLYLAFEEKVIDQVIRSKPNDARYFVGLVQWQPGELREELRQGYWHIARTSAQRVMQTEPTQLWKELTNHAGELRAATPIRFNDHAAGPSSRRVH